MMKKTIRLCFLFFTVYSGSTQSTEGSLLNLYLEFEGLYLEKNVTKLKNILDEKYILVVEVNAGENVIDRRELSKEGLLSLMTQSMYSDMSGASSDQDIEIKKTDEHSFCATVKYSRESNRNRNVYREVRRACFKILHNEYQVISHQLLYYIDSKK